MASAQHESTISSGTLENARQFDDPAWDRIIAVYHERVFRQVLRSGVGEQAALELVDDVFQQALLKIETFSRVRPEQGFGKWLNKLTLNLTMDFIRFKRKDPLTLGSGAEAIVSPERMSLECVSSDSPPKSQNALMKQAALSCAMDEVSEECRAAGQYVHWQCFWMRFIENSKDSDIARLLQLTEGNVRVICFRIKTRVVAVARGHYRDRIENDQTPE